MNLRIFKNSNLIENIKINIDSLIQKWRSLPPTQYSFDFGNWTLWQISDILHIIYIFAVNYICIYYTSMALCVCAPSGQSQVRRNILFGQYLCWAKYHTRCSAYWHKMPSPSNRIEHRRRKNIYHTNTHICF